MKSVLYVAAAMTALAAASSASAYSFSPTGTPFAATGTLSVTAVGKTVQCNTTMTGATARSGKASISSATFTGSSPVCALINPTGLPWKLAAKSAKKAVIDGVGVSGGGGSCGPTNVPIKVSGAGVFTFSNASISGGCKVDGTLQTSPKITITNP